MTSEDELIPIYRETIRALYRHVSQQTGGDRELAEDVTQETWLRAVDAWRKRGGIPDDPLAWLRTVSRNLLANHFKRLRPAPLGTRELDLEQREIEPPTPEAAALLHWGLTRLGRRRAQWIEAHHLDGRSIRSIAAEHGISERAVEGRLRRSRLALRAELAPFMQAEGDTT